MEATYQPITKEADGIDGVVSKIEMDWHSGKNFCSSLGKTMVSLSDSKCVNGSCDWSYFEDGILGEKMNWWTKNKDSYGYYNAVDTGSVMSFDLNQLWVVCH